MSEERVDTVVTFPTASGAWIERTYSPELAAEIQQRNKLAYHGLRKLEVVSSIDDMAVDELQRALENTTSAFELIQSGVGPTIRYADGQRGTLDPFIPYILARRQAIVERLEAASRREEREEIRDAVTAAIADPDQSRQLLEQLIEISRNREVSDATLREQLAPAVLEVHKADARDRKWKLWWSLLQREPVAVLVGALLLVGFSGVIVVAMWTHTSVPEVVVNMVLLILGFFFGQTTSGKDKSGE